ncbi:flagellar hook-length control protein FliK [Alishewanella sp. HL-SH05]|uniref:flagellar hook-length control protein FliK n=1 Tax=Alishewanella sp. HL-SH05 TaxID=3461145 RepID=UPI0040412375
MLPFNFGQLTTNTSLNPQTTVNSGVIKLGSAVPYPAMVVSSHTNNIPNVTQQLLLQSQQGLQRLALSALPPLPLNVPLQLSFNATTPDNLNVRVMQWQGNPQAQQLTAAQTTLLLQPEQLNQVSAQLASGKPLNHLAGQAVTPPLAAQLATLQLVKLPSVSAASSAQSALQNSSSTNLSTNNNNQAANTLTANMPSQRAPMANLQNAAVFQTLSPQLQLALQQPAVQISVFQQLQTASPLLQLNNQVLNLTPPERQQLKLLLQPLVTQATPNHATERASWVLLIQPLKDLGQFQLPGSALNRPLQLSLSDGSQLTLGSTQTHNKPDDASQKSSATHSAATATAQTQLSQPSARSSAGVMPNTPLQEEPMKTAIVDKILSQFGQNSESTPKLQAGQPYFAKLQLTGQSAQFIVQTAQGLLQLPLTLAAKQLSAIPSDLPLQLSFKETKPGTIEIHIKVLSGLPENIQLTAKQAQLLQNPKQLAALQQSVLRGETITQLAGEPLAQPLNARSATSNSIAKHLSLILLPPANNNKTVNANLAQQQLQATAGANTANNAASSWQLSVQPLVSEHKIQLASQQFAKPLPLGAQPAPAAPTVTKLQPTDVSNTHWRQLLPLLQSAPATLSSLPDLPAEVQQVLNLLRQAQPDGSKVLTPPQVQEQLQAALNFQPLQSQPNMTTSAGTLAVAIQLLLGHLLKQPSGSLREPNAQRLAQNIGQLEPAQASNLLRALGSHSSALQLAQLQNAEVPANLQQWLIPLALQQQQESRISQILLEQKEREQKDSEQKQRFWQLTMKFDLADKGQLLAVAKLQDDDVQLQFYTDQPQALQQAQKFLPILTERCSAQGLTVSKAECQLGKIPDTLGSKRTSLISTQV